MVFLPSATPLGEFMATKYNLVFIFFFIHWWYIFLVIFFLCVWERYFFWMSITQQWGKNQKANPRHQDASLDSIFSLLLNVTEHCHKKIMYGKYARVQFHSQGNLSADDNHVFNSISIKDCRFDSVINFFVKLMILTLQTQTRNCCVYNDLNRTILKC